MEEDDMGDDDDDEEASLDSDALDDDNNEQNLVNNGVFGEAGDLDDEDGGPSLASDFTDSLTELRFGDDVDTGESQELSSDSDLINMLEWANQELHAERGRGGGALSSELGMYAAAAALGLESANSITYSDHLYG